MTWHLKDRELEEKLIAIDPKFVSRLDRVTKDTLEFEGKGFLVAGVEAVEVWYKDEVLFALDFSIIELEEVEEYNPHAWNNYPEVTPPYDVMMRIKMKNGYLRAGYLKKLRDGDTWVNPNGVLMWNAENAEIELFRPWED